MQLRHLLIALSLSALCPAQSTAQAATRTQTKHFTITRALTTPGSGNLATLASTDLITTFSPFNQRLGTLTNANLTWGVTQTIGFTVANNGTGGSIATGGGGGFYFNATNFSGNGGGTANHSPPATLGQQASPSTIALISRAHMSAATTPPYTLSSWDQATSP
jgi:hypothetical protein